MAQDAPNTTGHGLAITSVEPVSGECVVYDIEVEVDHSFIVHGAVVHNCQVCRSLDGQVYAIDAGPRPPIHISDRCTVIPELDEEFQKYMKGATRPSVADGKASKVDASESYYEWLKRQPASFQDEVLGPTRGKLFRDGGLSAKRFSELQLDRNFKPLTLEEMRAIEEAAFKKAGL
jgi:hypothetical protein